MNNRIENPNPVLHQLDLLPQLSLPWHPTPSQNGSNPLLKKLPSCYVFHFLLFLSHN
jgi:hypothetical protein